MTENMEIMSRPDEATGTDPLMSSDESEYEEGEEEEEEEKEEKSQDHQKTKRKKRKCLQNDQPEMLGELRQLWKEGKSEMEIVRAMNLSRNTVRYHLQVLRKHPELESSDMPQRQNRRKLVSPAEKADITMEAKRRDFKISSVNEKEFCELVLEVRRMHLQRQNKTSDHLKPLCYKTCKKLREELLPESITKPSVKADRRVEALHDLPSAVSQVAISYAIQGITPTAVHNYQNSRIPLRILPELYFNFDFVSCAIGEWENAKIYLTEGSTKALNKLSISPGVNETQQKRRCVKLMFITTAAGHVVGSIVVVVVE